MQPLKLSVLKVLAYFDVFDYPVTASEIKLYLDRPYTNEGIECVLHQLQEYNIIFKYNNFYSIRNDYALMERRTEGNRLAVDALKQANKIARFIMWFPFIKGVAVSGSLSKNFAYQGSDMDFFIITAANRLWLARVFFNCFFLLAKIVGVKDYFCLNYFIDETALEIPEKNIYTAIEIATLMPQQGGDVFAKFFEQNKWVKDYLPNGMPVARPVAESKGSYIKSIVQMLLNNALGNMIDTAIMHFYKRRWTKMMAQKKYTKSGFLLGSYIAEKHVCKHIPHFFQGKIISRFEERMNTLQSKYHPAEMVAV